jgi:excinuclease ABC subunit A
MDDVQLLVTILHWLSESGHSVVLIEHHPHVLAACDWLVELGPGGGPDGGHIVAAGTPEAVSTAGTATAPFLREVLEASP